MSGVSLAAMIAASAAGVAGAQVVDVGHVWAAGVVAGGGAGDAVHAAAAGAAAQAAPERVGSLGARVRAGGVPIPGGAVCSADGLGGVPGGAGDDGRMHGFGSPEPLVAGNGLAAPSCVGAAAAEHHVPVYFGLPRIDMTPLVVHPVA